MLWHCQGLACITPLPGWNPGQFLCWRELLWSEQELVRMSLIWATEARPRMSVPCRGPRQVTLRAPCRRRGVVSRPAPITAQTTTFLRQEELQKYNHPCVDPSRGRHQSQSCRGVVSKPVPPYFSAHVLQVYKARVWMDVLPATVGPWSTKLNAGITPKGNHSQKTVFYCSSSHLFHITLLCTLQSY